MIDWEHVGYSDIYYMFVLHIQEIQDTQIMSSIEHKSEDFSTAYTKSDTNFYNRVWVKYKGNTKVCHEKLPSLINILKHSSITQREPSKEKIHTNSYKFHDFVGC